MLLCFRNISAQNDSLDIYSSFDAQTVYRVKTKDGAVYVGYIIQSDSFGVKVENKNTSRVYTVSKENIDSITRDQKKKLPKLTELYGENEHADFYMLAQSALPLEDKALKTQYHWFSIEHADYTLSDNWAVTANSLLFAPLSLGVKCHYPLLDDWHVGANLFGTGNILSVNSPNSPLFLGAFAMGKLTKGNTNQNITVNAGLMRLYVAGGFNLFNNRTTTSGNIFFGSFAFCNRIGPRAALVGESWYFPQAQLSFSGAGIKLIGNAESSWTFGCYGLYFGRDLNYTSLKGRVIPIPYLNYSSKF